MADRSILAAEASATRVRRIASRVWPALLALAIVVVVWELIYLAEVRPHYVLPSPGDVGTRLLERLTDSRFWSALATTMSRGLVGFAMALVVGTVLGVLVSRSRILRAAIGSLLTGLQTMPSIAWFPFAILIFGITEEAILFVVVLGAAPSIANGLIGGIDDVPPQLLKAGHTLGARGFGLYRHVVLPAALPMYVAGLKQGWAFAWRSLMAGELLVIIAARPSLGVELQFFREFADTEGLLATMIVILVIGMVVDGVFSWLATGIRTRRGLGALKL